MFESAHREQKTFKKKGEGGKESTKTTIFATSTVSPKVVVSTWRPLLWAQTSTLHKQTKT